MRVCVQFLVGLTEAVANGQYDMAPKAEEKSPKGKPGDKDKDGVVKPTAQRQKSQPKAGAKPKAGEKPKASGLFARLRGS